MSKPSALIPAPPPDPPSSQTGAGPVRVSELDGYRLQWVDDGTDYPALWTAFREGRLAAEPLAVNRPFRDVYRIEAAGRRFVFKRDKYVENRWEKRLLVRLLGATRYTRILRLTSDAVVRGCRTAQEVYLVAERMNGRQCLEAYLIAEYVEGRHLTPDEIQPRREEIARALADIHAHGLASNDCQPNNFLVTGHGLRMIDLDMSNLLVICQLNDIQALEKRFGLRSPLTGIRWILRGILRFRVLVNNFSRRLRGKKLRKY